MQTRNLPRSFVGRVDVRRPGLLGFLRRRDKVVLEFNCGGDPVRAASDRLSCEGEVLVFVNQPYVCLPVDGMWICDVQEGSVAFQAKDESVDLRGNLSNDFQVIEGRITMLDCHHYGLYCDIIDRAIRLEGSTDDAEP